MLSVHFGETPLEDLSVSHVDRIMTLHNDENPLEGNSVSSR
jgi:hypothetical protein